VANGDIADAPASAGNLADLLSLDAPDDSAGASASASSAVTALQDLLSGDLSSDVAAAGMPIWQTLLACTYKLRCLSRILAMSHRLSIADKMSWLACTLCSSGQECQVYADEHAAGAYKVILHSCLQGHCGWVSCLKYRLS